MADNKQLIIGSRFDAKGLSAAEKALKSLRKESESFNKVFKQFTDPKNSRQQAFFAKEIANSASHMSKFKLATESTSKIMKDLFIRRLNEEKAALDNVNRSLERGSKFYAKRQEEMKWYSSMSGSAGAKGVAATQGKLNALQVSTAGQLAKKQDIQETIKAMQDDPGIRNRLVGLISGITAVAGVAEAGFAMYQRGKTLGDVNTAAAIAPAASFGRSLAGGDLGALATMSNAGDMQKIIDAGGVGAPTGWSAAKIIGKIGAGAGMGSLGGPLGALIGGGVGLLSAGGDIQDLFSGGPARQAAESQQREISSLRQKNFVTDILAGDLTSNAASREAASLRLGGGFMRSVRGGYGLGTTEGILGNAMGLERAVGLPSASPMFDTMFQLQKGRAGTNVSNESAVGLLGGLSMGTGGAGAASSAAMELLSRAFANGFRNARVGEEIAGAIGNFMQSSDRFSASNPMNMALANMTSTHQFLTGQPMDMMTAQHIKGGMGVMENVFHHGGPFEAMRLGVAQSILSKTPFGRTETGGFLRSAMSQMSTADILAGNINPLVGIMGGKTPGNIEAATSMLGQFRDQSMPMALKMLFHKPVGAISKLIGGGNFMQNMASLTPDEAAQTKYLLKTRMNEGGAGAEDYQAFMDIMGGLTGAHSVAGKSGRGRNLGAGINSAALSNLTARDVEMMGAEAKDPRILKSLRDFNTEFKNLMDIFDTSTDPLKEYNFWLHTIKETAEGVPWDKIRKEIAQFKAENTARPAKEHLLRPSGAHGPAAALGRAADADIANMLGP